jgi:hypothetical protein
MRFVFSDDPSLNSMTGNMLEPGCRTAAASNRDYAEVAASFRVRTGVLAASKARMVMFRQFPTLLRRNGQQTLTWLAF